MIKKTVTYEDFNGNEVTEDFYFNLTKAELIEMELEQGGLGEHLKAVAESGDNRLIWKTFKSIVDQAYGVRSEDGKRFIKNAEVLDEFKGSNAYSEVVFSIAEDADQAVEFVKGIIPSNLSVDDIQKSQKVDKNLFKEVESNAVSVSQEDVARFLRENPSYGQGNTTN